MQMSLGRMLRKARQFQKIRNAGIEALRSYQQEQLERLVSLARAKSPFFRELYEGLPEHGFGLNDLPVTNKAMIMDRYDDAVTDPRLKKADIQRFIENPSNEGKLFQEEFVITHTSGTTGLRGFVSQHIAEWETFFALNSLKPCRMPPAKGTWSRRARSLFTGIRVAVVAGTGVYLVTPQAFLIMPPLFKMLSRVKIISTLTPVNDIVDLLNAFQPDRIHGYPTMLEALAHKQLDGALSIHPLDISASSEPLTSRARSALKAAFDVFVENTYGSTEGWVMGKECPYGQMHLFLDGSIVEAVDEHNLPTPPGQLSAKILVTNLHNFTQPVIRYEMSDSIVPQHINCPCGSVLPTIHLLGREDDTLYFQARDGSSVPFPPMLIETLMLEVKGYTMFQVQQVERNRIIVHFVPAKGACPEEVRNHIRNQFSTHFERHGLGASVTIEIDAVEEVSRSSVSGKGKQISSLVGPPETHD